MTAVEPQSETTPETDVEVDLEADPDEALHDTASVSLFEGDEGTLELAVRRALVTLLKQRFVSARTHPQVWRVVTSDEQLVRSRLNDLFLELQVDRVREVAWKRQAVPETGGRFPTLLHDVAWSREETLVLVHLRDRYRVATAAGEDRVFIDREDVVEHVAGFRPPHATDQAGDEKRARNAVTSINKSGLLIGAPTDHRFEVSEAIESLLPLERLRELLEELRRTNDPDAGPADEPLFADGTPDREHDEEDPA